MCSPFDYDKNRILKMSKNRRVHPDAVVAAISDFLYLQKRAVDAIKSFDGVLSQKEIITGIKDLGKSLDFISGVVHALSEKVQTDEAKVKLAEINMELGRLTASLTGVYERVNKDNNGFWKFVLAGVACIFGICGICYFKDDVTEIVSDDSESNPCR